MSAYEREELRRVAGLADDLVTGLLEQTCESRPKEDVVIGERDPLGGHPRDYRGPDTRLPRFGRPDPAELTAQPG